MCALGLTPATRSGGRQLKAAWEAGDTLSKWEATAWAKKRKAHALKATATDFDRFQVRPSPHPSAATSRVQQFCRRASQVMVARKERAAKRAAAMAK